MKYQLFIFGVLVISLVNSSVTKAQMEIGHYAPGVMGIRDFIMPAPGFYGALYSYKYTTQQVNNADGDEIKSITINPGPGPGTTLDLNVDVNVGVIAPTLIWVSDWKILGASYGAYITPAVSNTSIGASLSIYTGSGRSSKESEIGFGDLYVQPLWLTWTKEHFDFAFAYGFYAPVGKYETVSVTLPIVGPITAEAADNIGLGFWTHQFQGAASWYPWADRRMAIAGALTYELHGNKKEYDFKPGSNLSLNWGISQYLPLQKDQKLLLEIGPAGYSSWQVTEDSGDDAANTLTKDNVSGIGGQIGLTQVDWGAVLNFHYFYEFSAKDRFQGESIGINFAIIF